MEQQSLQHRARRLAWGGALVGFALGGFFDGIVLHQVLQWHHLLSGVAPGETPQDLRFQILFDGLFHALHYVFALAGLGFLWAGRRTLSGLLAGRRLLGWALAGFGSWHILDAVASHWVLGIHRIRMDVENPLLWDLGWLIPFGIVVLAAGVRLLRRSADDEGHEGPRGRAVALSLALGAAVAGPVAALPPSDRLEDGRTLVVFRPGTTFADVLAAADAVDGRLIWTDESEAVWLIATGPGASPSRLYRHGALLVSDGIVAAGCLSWSEV